jgi:hypothetical protein
MPAERFLMVAASTPAITTVTAMAMQAASALATTGQRVEDRTPSASLDREKTRAGRACPTEEIPNLVRPVAVSCWPEA